MEFVPHLYTAEAMDARTCSWSLPTLRLNCVSKTALSANAVANPAAPRYPLSVAVLELPGDGFGGGKRQDI